MRLDTRPVIDQLTEDTHAAEVEDRLAALGIAVDDAYYYLTGHEDDQHAKELAHELGTHFDELRQTVDSYLSRPE